MVAGLNAAGGAASSAGGAGESRLWLSLQSGTLLAFGIYTPPNSHGNPYERESKLLKGGYIGDYIGGYHRGY